MTRILLRFCALALGVCLAADSAASADTRTRRLPDLSQGVEASLVARAAGRERVHALIEVPRGAEGFVEREGIGLLRPAGGRLWLASVPVRVLSSASSARSAVRIWDLRPADRVAPGLAERVERFPAGEPAELRIKVFRDESPDGVRAAVVAAGGRILREIPKLGIVDISAPRGVLAQLAARDDVRWIEAVPGPPESAANDMRLDAEVNAVQSAGLDGTGIVIGLWDTGAADVTHPDFGTRLLVAESGMPVTPHTTHVAALALGDGTNSQAQGGGGLQWRGVATTATGVNYDFVNEIAEIDSAIAQYDIDVSQNSWVYPVSAATGNCDVYGDYASEAPEFDEIVTGIYGKSIPVVFAAGNERDDGDCTLPLTGGFGTIPPPGTAKNVITVGAHQSDAGQMTPFSSWGPTDDGRMKPDLSAPGCQLSGDFGIKSAGLSGSYVVMCGTSQAAPAVSGAIAVIMEEWAARFSGAPRPATCKALLGGFAKDRAKFGPDYRFGLGALNLQASVDEVQTGTTVEDSVADGVTDTFTFFVPASAAAETLAVTLAWDDPVAAELADPALINDLDLELVAPTMGTYQAYVLDPANPDSLAVRGANRRDNLEQVRVLAPEAGLWTARVIGYSVPQGPQEYSLVGFDQRPPADPAAVAAVAVDDTTVTATWIRAGDVDRAGTLVVRSLAPVTWTPTDGTGYSVGAEPSPGVMVIAADDTDHSASPLADAPLAPATEYHYAFFSYDEIPNYSAGIADTATTTSFAVDAPVVSAGTAVPRFFREGVHPVRELGSFRFELPRTAVVALELFDASGRRVATVIRGERKAGSHPVRWSARDDHGRPLPSGVYFARFRTEGLVATEKIVVVR